MSEHDDLVQDFLVESYENLDQMDRDFVALERTPDDRDLISRIFRSIHTIKGTCGFFNFPTLESVAHAGENLLCKLRDGDLAATPPIVSALLEVCDAVRAMLNQIEETLQDGGGDYSALVARLKQLQENNGAPESPASTGEPETPATPAPASVEIPQPALENPEGAVAPPTQAEPEPGSDITDLAPAIPDDEYLVEETGPKTPDEEPLGSLLVKKNAVSQEALEEALERQRSGDPRHVGELLVESGHCESSAIVDVLNEQKKVTPERTLADNSVRVNVENLDRLMNMVGELVLARNQTLQFSAVNSDPAFHAATQRLDLITTELQEAIMKTRMQPVGSVWNKFPRVVRDLATSLRKNIRLEMEGRETELDKTILEAIKDPLTHIVRNAVDHGIEAPEDRFIAKKPEEGLLRLRAFHEGGQVNIEVLDDGAGIDPDRLRQKAIEKGIITAEHAARMGERETLNLIFAPGFSTAAKVTNVSGRGVGMDVVKTNIEKIGGTVEIGSVKGKGTTLRIKIPLTLAIIPALLVRCNGDRFAIPQMSLLELVRLDHEHSDRIEYLHGAPVYRLRGKLLPLVRLNELLGLEREDATGTENIVVLQAENTQFGLVVDSIQDTEEIVVKPLGKQLKHISQYAGATIMGDGNVALILDVQGIAESGGINQVAQSQQASAAAADGANGELAGENESVLLVRSTGKSRFAIPLSQVARLEEFARNDVEKVGDRQAIQYRGQILPLVDISEYFDEPATPESTDSPVRVVVYGQADRMVGLVVDRVEDITAKSTDVTGQASRRGVQQTAVIQGSIWEFLDMDAILQSTVASN